MSTDKSYEHVSELSKDQLKKSPTYCKYCDEFGRCTKCGEMTDVLNPCCYSLLAYEAGTIDPDVLWNQIEDELSEIAESQIYDQEGE